MLINDFDKIENLKQSWQHEETFQNESSQYVSFLFQSANNEKSNFKLPQIKFTTNALQSNRIKIKKKGKQTLNNLQLNLDPLDIIKPTKLDNKMMMIDMTLKFQQLKTAIKMTDESSNSVFLTKNKSPQKRNNSVYHVPDYTLFQRNQKLDISQELNMIHNSRQKFMRHVMDTRQRNRSLQLYGDDLSPVIDKEKSIQSTLIEQKAQQDLLNSVRKQYTQRSPLGNAYCGLKALTRKQQSKVLKRLI